MDITTSDVKANCEDLKVLGKGDFKALLKWRIALREDLGLDNKMKETEELIETVQIVDDVDEEQQISDELERLNAEAAARTKRERRRANEIRTRTIQRMQLQMTAPLDIGLEQQDMSLGGQDDFFNLDDTEKGLGGVQRLIDGDGDVTEDNDEDEVGDENEEILDSQQEQQRKMEAMEAELDGLYDAYQDRLRGRDAKFKVKEARRKNGEREEWSGIGEAADSDTDPDDDEEEEGGWDKVQAMKAIDSDDDSSENESETEAQTTTGAKRPHFVDDSFASSTKRPRLVQNLASVPSSSKAAQLWFSQGIFDAVKDDVDVDEEDREAVNMAVDSSSSGSESDGENMDDDDDDDFEVVPQDHEDDPDLWDAKDENGDVAKETRRQKLGLITPEAVTLAQQLVNQQTTKTKLINDGFNRYSLNSKDDLPSWFLDDEARHYKPNLPVTKDAIMALREKQRALDARPIKKIAEAKARKKLKAHQRLEKALKKAEGVNSTADLTEREKAQQIEKLMHKGLSSNSKAKKEVKVVVAKGAHKGIKGRPKGVKGRYTMVDARMRKEVRAKKRKEKASKGRKRN
ncbi:hypothetical protein H0H93_004217 [Arthromyces matolae]|nr:hypothetical protein H0H93_004217 [Arthromyces matolae]